MSRGENTGRKRHVNASDSAKRKRKADALPLSDLKDLKAFSIRQFCELHGISIDTYFRMQRAGTGPAIMKLAQGTRISTEAAEAWRRARETAGQERKRKAASAAEAEA